MASTASSWNIKVIAAESKPSDLNGYNTVASSRYKTRRMAFFVLCSDNRASGTSDVDRLRSGSSLLAPAHFAGKLLGQFADGRRIKQNRFRHRFAGDPFELRTDFHREQ